MEQKKFDVAKLIREKNIRVDANLMANESEEMYADWDREESEKGLESPATYYAGVVGTYRNLARQSVDGTFDPLEMTIDHVRQSDFYKSACKNLLPEVAEDVLRNVVAEIAEEAANQVLSYIRDEDQFAVADAGDLETLARIDREIDPLRKEMNVLLGIPGGRGRKNPRIMDTNS
jgi:hypothetical protein